MSVQYNLENCYDGDGDPIAIDQENIVQYNSENCYACDADLIRINYENIGISPQNGFEYQDQSEQRQFQENLGSDENIFEQFLPYPQISIENVENIEIHDEQKITNDNQRSTDLIYDEKQEIKQDKNTSEEVVIESNISQQKTQKIQKNKNDKENKETKNLPVYYYRAILKYVKEQRPSQKLEKKVAKLEKKLQNITIGSLRDLLKDEDVKQLSQDYLKSYQFLEDLLKSGKQQDIAPPIKYLNKIYTGCHKPDSLFNWKD